MKSGSAAETVHDCQTDTFRRNHFTEYRLHTFFIKAAKGIEEPMGNFFCMSH